MSDHANWPDTLKPDGGANVSERSAGRLLDAEIAEKVFGLPRIELKDAPCPDCGKPMRFCGQRSYCSVCSEWKYSPYREYSEDIAAAWLVVEEMARRGWNTNIEYKGKDREYEFTAEVLMVKVKDWYQSHAVGPTAEAICVAALRAVNAESVANAGKH